MHKLVDQKRMDYWRAKTESQVSARELWRAVDAILCRDSPSAAKPTRTANNFADFFESNIVDGLIPLNFGN